MVNCIQDTGAFKGTSNRFQNDIVECVGDVILDKIKSEKNYAFFQAKMLDETTNIAKLSQFSTVIRYVKDGNLYERFTCFADVGSDRTATVLSMFLKSYLVSIASKKVVAQGYDGAATFSGYLNAL